MGRFIYAGSPNDSYRLDDRVLAHLDFAIGAKFRLGDSFAFTLEGDDLRAGVGYHTLWMHPSISLQFRYDGDRAAIAVNPGWVGALIGSASSEGGLRVRSPPDRSCRRREPKAPRRQQVHRVASQGVRQAASQTSRRAHQPHRRSTGNPATAQLPPTSRSRRPSAWRRRRHHP